MQAEERVKTEASVLIISISTKKMVGLLRGNGNKNLRLAKKFFSGSRCSASPRETLFETSLR
jgi:hypothetical protein